MAPWLLIALFAYLGAQFRPARRGTWVQRWKRWWVPFLLAVAAMAKMAWQGFIVAPALLLWRRHSATRESRVGLQQALDRMLGRD